MGNSLDLWILDQCEEAVEGYEPCCEFQIFIFLTVFMIRRSDAFCPALRVGFFVNLRCFFFAMLYYISAVEMSNTYFHRRSVLKRYSFARIGLLQEHDIQAIEALDCFSESVRDGFDVGDGIVNVDNELHDEASDRQDSRNEFPDERSQSWEQA
jgi:hypothetical protein